jgi:hypothetical protein
MLSPAQHRSLLEMWREWRERERAEADELRSIRRLAATLHCSTVEAARMIADAVGEVAP